MHDSYRIAVDWTLEVLQCWRNQHVSERWRERVEKDGRRARAAWWEFTHRRLRTIIINISPGETAAAAARKMARYWTNNERLRRAQRTLWCKTCCERKRHGAPCLLLHWN